MPGDGTPDIAMQRSEYVAAHGNIDPPFPGAFPELIYPSNFGPEDHQGRGVCEECPLGHLADAGVIFPLRDDNLTYQFWGGDVEISLNPLGTDTLVFPAALLARYSPWFKSALSELWLRCGSTDTNNEPPSEPLVRFELGYDEDVDRIYSGRQVARFQYHSKRAVE